MYYAAVNQFQRRQEERRFWFVQKCCYQTAARNGCLRET